MRGVKNTYNYLVKFIFNLYNIVDSIRRRERFRKHDPI